MTLSVSRERAQCYLVQYHIKYNNQTTTMMKSLLPSAWILIAVAKILSNSDEVCAFAPLSPPRSSLSKQKIKTTSSLSLTLPQHEHLSDITFLISDAADAIADVTSTAIDTATSSSSSVVEEGISKSSSFNPTYSKASYYTTLALYAASFPGLWSQIKRSTKAKVKRKTYVR